MSSCIFAECKNTIEHDSDEDGAHALKIVAQPWSRRTLTQSCRRNLLLVKKVVNCTSAPPHYCFSNRVVYQAIKCYYQKVLSFQVESGNYWESFSPSESSLVTKAITEQPAPATEITRVAQQVGSRTRPAETWVTQMKHMCWQCQGDTNVTMQRCWRSNDERKRQ
jgi:hypothetical protein